MAEPPDSQGDRVFGDMTFPDRADAAFRHFSDVMRHLAAFQAATVKGDPSRQSVVVKDALDAIVVLLRVLLLDVLLRARSVHMLGPWPEADDDVITLYALRELHIVLDWVSDITPLDSIEAARADLGRLERRQAPTLFQRDHYEDPRRRDVHELTKREFTVLVVYFVAGARQLSVPVLLERLDVRVTYAAFMKWAAKVDQEQRDLMTEAGRLEAIGGELPLAQAARLSKRAQDVLLRNDPERFPALAGLTDEGKLHKLLGRARRAGRPAP